MHWLDRPAAYLQTWQAMRAMTEARTEFTRDEIWLVEHEPVYTLGQAGKPQHILHADGIPVVHCDRGGQVTYHGPGQIVAYTLVDLRRRGLYVKQFVALLEDAAIAALAELGEQRACRKPGAPGVYIPMPEGDLAKIAALGVKIRNGRAYHGLALNVDMNLSPFLGINACGYEGLRTIDLTTCGIHETVEHVGQILAQQLVSSLNSHL